MNKKEWKLETKSEIEFWNGWLPKGSKKYLKKDKLKSYFKELIGDKKKVNIADIGSGAISVTGYEWDNVKINLFPSDVLVDEYKKLYTKFKIYPRVPIEKQDMTYLTYGDGLFDIVHCSNALDHCFDPYKAVKEMIRICKLGGWVYLEHLAHVGKMSNYKHLHQWNIDGMRGDEIISWGKLDRKCDDCIFWNKEKKFLLSEISDGFITKVETKYMKNRLIVTSKFKKHV